MEVAAAIAQNDSLRVLHLEGLKPSNRNMSVLALGTILSDVHLVKLCLKRCNLEDGGVSLLFSLLKSMTSLRWLSLERNRLTIEGVKHACNLVLANPSIEHLDLSLNDIEDEGVQYVSLALCNSACKLLSLHIHGVSMGTEGVFALGAMLRVNRMLQSLVMFNNYFSEESVRAIESAVRENPVITECDMWTYRPDAPTAKSVLDSIQRTLSQRAFSPALQTLLDPLCDIDLNLPFP